MPYLFHLFPDLPSISVVLDVLEKILFGVFILSPLCDLFGTFACISVAYSVTLQLRSVVRSTHFVSVINGCLAVVVPPGLWYLLAGGHGYRDCLFGDL